MIGVEGASITGQAPAATRCQNNVVWMLERWQKFKRTLYECCSDVVCRLGQFFDLSFKLSEQEGVNIIFSSGHFLRNILTSW